MKTIFTLLIIVVFGFYGLQAQNAPTTPMDFGTPHVAKDSIRYSWRAVTDATSYELFVSKFPNLSSPVSVLTITDAPDAQNFLSVSVKGLEPHTQYFAAVRARNSLATSPFSNTISRITNFPLNVVQVLSSTSVRLQWNATPGAARYQINVLDFGTNQILSFTTTSTEFVVTGLTASHLYHVSVGAVTINNSSLASSESAIFQTLPEPPVAPAKPNIVAAGFTSISLSWASVAGATSYDVLVSGSPDLSSPLQIFVTTAPFFTIHQRQPNTSYYIAIRATNPGGASPLSPVLAAHTLFNITTVQVTSPTSALFAWQAVTGATRYHVSVLNLDPSKPDVSTLVTATNVLMSGLGAANRYTVQVTALDSNNAVIANSQSINFQTIPGAPSNVTLTFVNPSILIIQWTAAEGAELYRVQVSQNPGFSPLSFDLTSNGTAAVIASGLTPGAHYFVRVISLLNGNPVGNPSPVAEITIPSNIVAKKQELLFPNPANDKVTIELPNDGESSITIKDFTNTPHFQGTYRESSAQIDLTGIPAGLYIVEIVQGSLRKTARLQIE